MLRSFDCVWATLVIIEFVKRMNTIYRVQVKQRIVIIYVVIGHANHASHRILINSIESYSVRKLI